MLQKADLSRSSHEVYTNNAEDDDFYDVLALSSAGRCATMCLFGCISIL